MTSRLRDARVRTFLAVLLTAAAYFACARLGYLFAIPQGIVTLWPPSGLMLALLALSPKRNWPALTAGGLIGSIASDLLSGYTPSLAVAAAAANGAESLAAAWVLQWRMRGDVRLSSVRAVLTFTIGAVVLTNALTAWLGAFMLHAGFHTALPRAWFVWWVGDGLGMLLVAPVVIAIARRRQAETSPRTATHVEGVLLVVLLFVTAQATLGPSHHLLIEPGPYAVFPFLFWAAMRFGLLGASVGSLIVAAVASWNAALGFGPFVATGPMVLSTALQTYEFLSVATLSALMAAAVMDERLLASRRLIESELRYHAAEDRIQFALDAVGGGAWDRDYATGMSRWSPALEKLHGIPAGSFGGTLESFLALVHPDDRASVIASIATATRTRSDAHVLYRRIWPDGAVHWISSVGRTNYGSDGTPVSATGISLDITERRKLEEQFRQSQKMEAIGQLAGGVAHDFNNLLMAIQGYTSFIIDELPADSPSQPDLAEIILATKRATTLTRQLLAFSRRQQLTPVSLNLADSVHGMESMITRLIGEHIEVIVKAEHDTGQVRADAGQIEQVILNLALNARDAMPNGGVLIIEVRNTGAGELSSQSYADGPEGACVVLEVTDTGIGMDAETQSHVFEPFFTTKSRDQGTGLGLATVHGIVNQSGGRVWVRSEPGRGTTFSVCLPRVAGEAEKDERVSSARAE